MQLFWNWPSATLQDPPILVFVIAAGSSTYISIPKEATPDVNIPIIDISVSQKGISASDSERLLVKPIEDEVKTVEGIKEVRSTAYTGGGNVLLEFDAGFNADKAMSDIREKVDRAKGDLPTEADEQHGFGVLVNASFSIDEIEVIRLTYFPQVVEYSSRQPTNPREDPHHRWLRLEEEWMQLEVRNVASEFYTNVGRNAILRNPTFTFDTRETNNTTNTNTNTNTNTSFGTSHPSTNVLSSEMAPDAAREQALQILHNVQRHMDAAQPRPRRPPPQRPRQHRPPHQPPL